MALAWTFFAGLAAWVDFHPESWAHWGLVLTSVYLLLVGIAQQLIPQRPLLKARALHPQRQIKLLSLLLKILMQLPLGPRQHGRAVPAPTPPGTLHDCPILFG
jgi:hypothetical protein